MIYDLPATVIIDLRKWTVQLGGNGCYYEHCTILRILYDAVRRLGHGMVLYND